MMSYMGLSRKSDRLYIYNWIHNEDLAQDFNDNNRDRAY